MKSETAKARELLREKNCSLVLIKEKEETIFEQRGILPLVEGLSQKKDFLLGACAADKVIGKAAALLFVYGGISEVFAHVISEAAVSVFEEAKLPFFYETSVPYIINRDKTGMCPMEQKALPMHSPEEAFCFFRRLLLPFEEEKS